MQFRYLILAAAAALLLTACSAPPVFDGSAQRSAAPRATVAPAPGDRVHIIARGDTVYAIARQYGLATRDIIDANLLTPPYRLEPGDRLVVPGQRIHVVGRGETVYAISRRFGVDMASLTRLNGMGPPYTIFVGQKLRLPSPSGPIQAATTQAGIGDRAGTLQRSVPARDGGTNNAPDRVTATPLPEPATPRRVVTGADSTAGRAGAGTASAPPQAVVASLPPPVDFGPGKPKTKPPAPARSGPMPAPPAATGKFVWPVKGRVTERFGAKTGGLHNDGLNIAAPRGAPVRAVDNGVVAYAGDRIRGFGQMVLIKHSNGLITAYAHNDALLVARGDIVDRGQVIARVGSSGGVPVPQLHFEVRRGTVAVDPAKYLPG